MRLILVYPRHGERTSPKVMRQKEMEAVAQRKRLRLALCVRLLLSRRLSMASVTEYSRGRPLGPLVQSPRTLSRLGASSRRLSLRLSRRLALLPLARSRRLSIASVPSYSRGRPLGALVQSYSLRGRMPASRSSVCWAAYTALLFALWAALPQYSRIYAALPAEKRRRRGKSLGPSGQSLGLAMSGFIRTHFRVIRMIG